MSTLKKQPIPTLSDKEAQQYIKIINKATDSFVGTFDELENAIGMLMIGRLVGWKVLAIIHNKRSIRKYEEILGIDVREMFPEEGPLAAKSIGYKAALALGNFWKAVSGDLKIEDRREMIK
ncbi:MAG: hypothetical protein WA435_02790 [Gallionellaceae bacterium]